MRLGRGTSSGLWLLFGAWVPFCTYAKLPVNAAPANQPAVGCAIAPWVDLHAELWLLMVLTGSSVKECEATLGSVVGWG